MLGYEGLLCRFFKERLVFSHQSLTAFFKLLGIGLIITSIFWIDVSQLFGDDLPFFGNFQWIHPGMRVIQVFSILPFRILDVF